VELDNTPELLGRHSERLVDRILEVCVANYVAEALVQRLVLLTAFLEVGLVSEDIAR